MFEALFLDGSTSFLSSKISKISFQMEEPYFSQPTLVG